MDDKLRDNLRLDAELEASDEPGESRSDGFWKVNPLLNIRLVLNMKCRNELKYD